MTFSSTIFLKLDNLVHAIKDKVVEIKVHIPRKDCFVKSTSKTFEVSFEHAFDAIVNQIKASINIVLNDSIFPCV